MTELLGEYSFLIVYLSCFTTSPTAENVVALFGFFVFGFHDAVIEIAQGQGESTQGSILKSLLHIKPRVSYQLFHSGSNSLGAKN